MTLDITGASDGIGFHCQIVNGQLPPEPPLGNIEYKLKLNPANETRLQHLTSQLKWRLREGLGEAIYEIGVGDDGKLVGLSEDEMATSLDTIEMMAKSLGAEILLVRQFIYEGKRMAEVMLRQTPEDPDEFVDFRISVLGPVDSGKSTVVGVLSSGELDNGRGKARLNLFRHPHEIQTGRTSSISREILGFTTTGKVINYSMSDTPEQIFQQSFKLITFTDLAGHQKYFKTTISGLLASKPDFVMLVISCLNGSLQNIAEYLLLATALRLPVFVVVTKVDSCDSQLIMQFMNGLKVRIENTALRSLMVSNEDDCVTAAFHMASQTVVPVFAVSNVTGQNLNLMTKFLSMLPCTVAAKIRDLSLGEPSEFQIDKSFKMDGVGIVVTGILMRGKISCGDVLYLGPDARGICTKAQIKSIQRNHAPCRTIRSGQSAAVCLALFDPEVSIRRGMVLADINSTLRPCLEFRGILRVLDWKLDMQHARQGLQGSFHCGYIRQTVAIMRASDISSNDLLEYIVDFKFIKYPECLRPGDQFIFRDGKQKTIGNVESLTPFEDKVIT